MEPNAVPSVPTPNRPPLGLPRGSVRALLTLMIVAVVCLEVGRGRALDPLWTETLAIALAHYFTTRRFLELSPELVRRLKAEGYLPDEPKPLYLPGLTVRGLILLAFLALALVLQRQDRLFEPGAASVLGLVGAYLLGVVAQAIRARLFRRNRFPALGRFWEDLKALAALGVMGVTLVAHVTDRTGMLPAIWRELTLALALFYFGSR